MAFCSKCGQQVKENTSFCPSCGSAIKRTSEANQNIQNYSQQNSNNSLPPNNYLVWSILVTILCCLPFGIVAIVYSSKVNGYWMAGYQREALEAANNAKIWTIVSAAVGGAIILAYLSYVIFAYASISHNYL